MKSVLTMIHVIQGNDGPLLSYRTACNLGIIHVNVKHICDSPRVCDMLVQNYPKLFEGSGKLKNAEVTLHIDESVPSIAQITRRIPFHIRKVVAKELINLEEQGIIEKVEEPTPWVSPLVIIPKKNSEVRLRIDMRRANKAINRERHSSLTVDDLLHNLNGATVCTKLDLRPPESRYITTFTTHKGLHRYTRLNFGTNSASEMFQNIISEEFHDIPGTIHISDDVIFFGKIQAEHDKALQVVFVRFPTARLSLTRQSMNSTRICWHFLVSSFPTKVSHLIQGKFEQFRMPSHRHQPKVFEVSWEWLLSVPNLHLVSVIFYSHFMSWQRRMFDSFGQKCMVKPFDKIKRPSQMIMAYFDKKKKQNWLQMHHQLVSQQYISENSGAEQQEGSSLCKQISFLMLKADILRRRKKH